MTILESNSALRVTNYFAFNYLSSLQWIFRTYLRHCCQHQEKIPLLIVPRLRRCGANCHSDLLNWKVIKTRKIQRPITVHIQEPFNLHPCLPRDTPVQFTDIVLPLERNLNFRLDFTSHRIAPPSCFLPTLQFKMSIFSRLKGAKKQKVAAASDNQPPKEPYRHVPTHAAIDALSGAPSSWKSEDKPKIRELNQRRSQMMLRQASSSTSNFSVGPSYPVSTLPRTASYNSYNPTWWDRGDQSSVSESHKGQSVDSRSPTYADYSLGSSPLVANVSGNNGEDEALGFSSRAFRPVAEFPADIIPVSSSSASDSSVNALEIKTSRPRPHEMVFTDNDIFDRLHKSTTRKVGEAPINEDQSIAPMQAMARKSRWSKKGKETAIVV